MPPVNHALLSLSGSARWLNCGPSARLEQQYPESSSVFAEEGTAAHERGEWKIRKYLHERMKEPRSDFDSEEMEHYTDQYAQFVIDAVEEMKKTCPVPMVLVETRLDITKYVPESFGTADMILMGDGKLHIMDLKYGKGVSVSADHNSQLMLYALGALEAYGFLYDITDVSMTIIQPRLENFDTFSIKADELRRWGEEYVRPRAIRAFKGEGELVSGPHCRFCKHRPHCTKCAEDALSLAREEFADLDAVEESKIGPIPAVHFKDPMRIDHDEIEAVLPLLGRIRQWIDDVFSFVSEEAIQHGIHWDGYKVVEGRSIRKFVDEKKVEAAAVAAGYHDIYKQSLLTLTEMEKLMGKKEFQRILGEMVYRPPGKLTLAPEADKRPAVDLTAARDEFEALD